MGRVVDQFLRWFTKLDGEEAFDSATRDDLLAWDGVNARHCQRQHPNETVLPSAPMLAGQPTWMRVSQQQTPGAGSLAVRSDVESVDTVSARASGQTASDMPSMASHIHMKSPHDQETVFPVAGSSA
jgi:hypothetical protein